MKSTKISLELPDDPVTWQALILQVQKGNMHAFEKLVYQYQSRLSRLAYTFVKNETVAEDMVQESWIKILRQIQYFKRDSSFITWANCIVMNTCRDYLRRPANQHVSIEALCAEDDRDAEYTHKRLGLVVEDSFDSADDHARYAQLHVLISKHLSSLHREVVQLFYIEQRHVPEIAVLLGIPVGTVLSRLHTARRYLRPYAEALFAIEYQQSGRLLRKKIRPNT